MSKELESVEKGFGLFKRMTEFVKKNFFSSLLTLLLLVLVGGMVGLAYFAPKYIQKILDNYPSQTYTAEETEEGFKLDSVINSILQDSLLAYSADRASLIQFHNGSHSLGGIPFKYISITHERITSGVSSEILSYQNLPTSILGEYAESMIQGNYIAIMDVSTMKENGFQQLMIQKGMKSRCMYPLFDSSDRFVGYIALDYIKKSMPLNPDGTCICKGLSIEAKILEKVLYTQEAE